MSNLPPRPPRPVKPESTEPVEMITMTNQPEEQPEKRVIKSAIPGVTESGMFFELYTFHPEDSIPKGVLLEVLRAARLTFSPENFAKLSPEAQRQFFRLDRSGGLQRVRPGQTRSE